MYIKKYKLKKKNKIYEYIYLVRSKRVGKSVKTVYISNLTKAPKNVILAIENELNGKTKIKYNVSSVDDIKYEHGKKCGGLFAIKQILEELNIVKALGNDKKNVKYAMIQIISRIFSQSSRNYIANKWFNTQAITEVFGLTKFSEDVLYKNLEWLADNQDIIEKRLFKLNNKSDKLKNIFLYDITSSYFEGEKNEYASKGYNRDKKTGKMQIVIGLMTDENGYPVTFNVFKGNTSDCTTVIGELNKLKERFKVENVIFVGDKGMIKKMAIDDINEKNWYYITSITKPQIETLLKEKVIQLELFTENLLEVENDNIRYVLHKNNYKAAEVKANRKKIVNNIEIFIENKNKYLNEHKKASVTLMQEKINKKISSFRLKKALKTEIKERKIILKIDEKKLEELGFLDGCYILKSNAPNKVVDTKNIQDRYKDLAQVEQAFRTIKQSVLHVRPIFVRKAEHTIGHVFVCVLAYYVVKYICEKCKDLNFETKYILNDCLDNIPYNIFPIKNHY